MPILIYCHTHRATGRKYVGQTSSTLERRWRLHCKGHSGARVLYRAIREYGPEAFDHETLEVLETHEAANAAEQRWIATLGCRLPQGFNVHPGGSGRPTREVTRAAQRVAGIARMAALTPEQRREAVSRMNAALSPEQRRETTRKTLAAMTPEKRRELARKARAAQTPEQVSEAMRKANAARTPEQRRENARRASAAKTSEQCSASMRKVNAARTPEQRSEIMRKANAARTPEQRLAISRKAVAASVASRAARRSQSPQAGAPT